MTHEQLTNITAALDTLDAQDEILLRTTDQSHPSAIALRLNILNSKVSLLHTLISAAHRPQTDTPTTAPHPAPPLTAFKKQTDTLRSITNLLPTLADPLTPPSQLALILVLHERLTAIENVIENAIQAAIQETDTKRNDTTTPNPTEDTKQP